MLLGQNSLKHSLSLLSLLGTLGLTNLQAEDSINADGSCSYQLKKGENHSESFQNNTAVKSNFNEKDWQFDKDKVSMLVGDSGLVIDVYWSKNIPSNFKQKLQVALNDIRIITKSHEFRESVMAKDSYTCLAPNRYDHSGAKIPVEVLEYINSKRPSIRIQTYWAFSSAIAKTGGNVISFNRRFLERSQGSILNTLFHETMHAIGFGHCGQNNPRLYPGLMQSVPYQLGKILQEIYQKMEGGVVIER